MPRIIEIVLFLTPLIGFMTWRLLFPSRVPPLWLMCGLAGLVVLMLLALFWLHQQDASDAREAYVPAYIENGHVIPSKRAPP